MSHDLQSILAGKRALRRDLAARPIEEKLRMLDALRERELMIRESAGRRPNKVAEPPARYVPGNGA